MQESSKSTILYIKNMVCSRCKMVVKSVFEELGLQPIRVELGEVELTETDISQFKANITQSLEHYGFELLDDKRAKVIAKVKTLIIDLIHTQNNRLDEPLSSYLSNALHRDYSALSNLFSEVEGITIEKYYILQKIEKVKELLVYDELTLSEIAYQLNYSSVAYLSNQFKKITGLTPSHFKGQRNKIKRNSLEEL